MNGWKALGFNTYKEYLCSDLWLEKRDYMIKLKPECELCDSITNLQVHHITYDNVGNEKKRDIMVVCKICHKKIHKK